MQLAYVEEILFDNKNPCGRSGPRHWATCYKNIPMYGIHTLQSSESMSNVSDGHNMAREKCTPYEFHEMYTNAYQRAQNQKEKYKNCRVDCNSCQQNLI